VYLSKLKISTNAGHTLKNYSPLSKQLKKSTPSSETFCRIMKKSLMRWQIKMKRLIKSWIYLHPKMSNSQTTPQQKKG
jgi:hypothetical protein